MLFFLSAVLLLLFIYYKIYKPHQYWKERNIVQIKSYPLIGSAGSFMMRKVDVAQFMTNVYNEAADERYVGMFMFNTPLLLIKDLDLIKQVFVKSFDHFVDRNNIISKEIDPILGKGILFQTGQHWRNMRATLSPAFTGSKMRYMFSLIAECSEILTAQLTNISNAGKPIDIEFKDLTTRYATDVVASCAFGIECNSLKEKDNEFYLKGQQASFNTGIKPLKFFGYMMSKKLMTFLKVSIFTEEENNYFRNLVKTMFEIREREGITRPDMIHLLLEAKKGKLKYEENTKVSDTGFATVEESDLGKIDNRGKVEFDDDDFVAQSTIFLIAGFDTVSTTMSFMAYELALNEDIQRRLQLEIDETMEEFRGKLTYESLMKMKYLDMVVCETLRKWPPLLGIDRMCTKPITIQPTREGQKPLNIEVGQLISLNIYAIQNDPKYFPEPSRFDPERFNDENKKNIVPFTYIPFSAGPRNCIGSRFALLECKAFIVLLLHKFDITVTEKTSIPLKLDKRYFALNPEDGFWLGLKLRSK